MRQPKVEMVPHLIQGGFTARIPDIPAHGEGETQEEALADLRDALQGYIETFGVNNVAARLRRVESSYQFRG
jgi:hypothetical protein